MLRIFAALFFAAAFAPQAVAASNLGTVRAADLPPEARQVVARIAQGGPFPYRKDGTTFGNRERRLPSRGYGYYREYTVPTPGVHGRGARRIVTGREGELYYTDDHYRSFKRILQ